jgi:hypothetical protein
MSSSEMGRKYESIPDEYIGLCTNCTLVAGIKTWTSAKIKENNEVLHKDEWEKLLKEMEQQDKIVDIEDD